MSRAAIGPDAVGPIGTEHESPGASQTFTGDPSCTNNADERLSGPSGSGTKRSPAASEAGAPAEVSEPSLGALWPEASDEGLEAAAEVPSGLSATSDVTRAERAERRTDLEAKLPPPNVDEGDQFTSASEQAIPAVTDGAARETGSGDHELATTESETTGDAGETAVEVLEADRPPLDGATRETGSGDHELATTESETTGDAGETAVEVLDATESASSYVPAMRAEREKSSRLRSPRPPTRDNAQPSRRPSIDRATPLLDPEFRLPEAYLKWNRVLADQCLLDRPRLNLPVYLSVTPMILASAWEASEGDLLSPALAQREFSDAVSLAYRTVVMNARQRIWTLASCGHDGTPNSIAFLASSVLAAYMMRSDETVGPNAYYQRFSDLLGCDMVAGHPEGFDVEDFGSLWLSLSSWVAATGQALALPTDETGVRRHIAYPLCHVPLREVDIEKLPDFFSWAGLEPGSRADLHYLGSALERWSASSQGRLSQAGRQALNDDRRDAVEAQMALELGAWDGSLVDRQGTRTATVQIMMDVIRHQPVLSYLPRRPSAFPAVFDDGIHLFESAADGWYGPEAIARGDGEDLRSGFSWSCRTSDGPFTLRRPPATSFALRAGDFTGFISQRGLPIGMESAAACLVSLAAEATAYLTSVAGTACRPVDSAGLPNGWLLFRGVVPRSAVTPPPALDAWVVDAQVSITLRGGLRLGRRSLWMSGAAPEVLVGAPEGVIASIDGQQASVTNGRLETGAPLGAGQHVIEVGYERRRFEVVEPVCDVEHACDLAPSDERAFTVPLPAGCWTVIGAPGEVLTTRSDYPGTLLSSSFRPVWAISSPSRGKPDVIALTSNLRIPVDLSRCRNDDATRSWVALVYSTGVRHPPIGWVGGSVPEVDLRQAWRIYWRASKDLKRRWRRRL
jgi:hypothetical protein